MNLPSKGMKLLIFTFKINAFIRHTKTYRMIPNGLHLHFMDINDHLNAIYGIFYKCISLVMSVIIQFFRIFWNVFGIIMKRLQSNDMMNGKMDQQYEIIIKYQSEKTFIALNIGITMILLTFSLNITWEFMTLVNVIYHMIFISKLTSMKP